MPPIAPDAFREAGRPNDARHGLCAVRARDSIREIHRDKLILSELNASSRCRRRDRECSASQFVQHRLSECVRARHSRATPFNSLAPRHMTPPPTAIPAERFRTSACAAYEIENYAGFGLHVRTTLTRLPVHPTRPSRRIPRGLTRLRIVQHKAESRECRQELGTLWIRRHAHFVRDDPLHDRASQRHE